MTDQQALFAAFCIVPSVTVLCCIFACELRIQHREGDTSRFRRYGRSPDMLDDKEHKLKIKSRIHDNET